MSKIPRSKESGGITSRDWFAVGQTSANPPYYLDNANGEDECAKKFGVRASIQGLAALDVVSGYFFTSDPPRRTPGPLTSGEVLRASLRVMLEQGKPRVGWVISESVWQSSLQLVADDQTEDKNRCLLDLDIGFGPMAETEKDKMRLLTTAVGLKRAFGQVEFEALS